VFRQTSGTLIAGAIFSALLIAIAASDLRSRRIPNRLVLMVTAGGIAFSMSSLPPVYGLGFAVGGLVAGFLLWLPFHALRWIGAGDLKLAAACGAWLGFHGVVRASLVTAIVGGALALCALLWQRRADHIAADMILLVNTIRRKPMGIRVRPDVSAVPSAQLMPYGVALVIGALAVAWLRP
jgi:prepilin peptidase CpaA